MQWHRGVSGIIGVPEIAVGKIEGCGGAVLFNQCA